MAKEKKNFYELAKEVAQNLSSTQFSNSLFNKLFTAYLNTETEIKEFKNGEVVNTYHPTKEFRNYLVGVLCQYGVDKQDAERFVNGYEVKEKEVAAWGRPLIDGFMVDYLDMGKSYKFYPREDISAALQMVDVDPFEKTYKGNYGEVRVEYNKFRKIKMHSGAPAWLKTKTKIK